MDELDKAWALASRLTEGRQKRFRDALEYRLGGIHIVLDNVDDPGNRSAVFRSCDAFGISNVHVINQRKPRESSRMVSRKAEKWLNLTGYLSVEEFFERHEFTDSNKIWLARSATEALSLNKVFNLESPQDSLEHPSHTIWIVFGNEHEGISPEWNNHPHQNFWIPIKGFAESLNISVAAALTLHCATNWKRTVLGTKSDLTRKEKSLILLNWLERTHRSFRIESKENTEEVFHPQS